MKEILDEAPEYYDDRFLGLLALCNPEAVSLVHHTGEVPVVTQGPPAEEAEPSIFDWALLDYFNDGKISG